MSTDRLRADDIGPFPCQGAGVRLRAGVVAVACLLTAACTPTEPGQPTPTPTPSATTPSETTVEREQRIAYQAAETAYRTGLRLLNSEMARGGSTKVPPEIRAVATGPYLDELALILSDSKAHGESWVGQSKITKFIHAGYEPKELIMVACVDGRGISVKDRKGREIQRGVVLVYDLTARFAEEFWRIYSAVPREDSQCPA